MPPIIIVILLLLLLFAVFAGAGYYAARLIIYPKVFPFEETYQTEIDNGRIIAEEYTPWAKDEFTLRSPFGYDLSAQYHPINGSQRTVVISHGITWSRYGSVKYGALFRKRGYNVLIYDLRNHGRSGGTNTSFGYYEKEDLKLVVDWAFSRIGPGGIVGTVGESLGAATTLQHAAIDPRIAFALADCPYSDLTRLLAFRMREDMHLPRFPLLDLANLTVRVIAGWSFGQVSPIRDVEKTETPIFFVHGQDDTYILPQMSVEMYEAKRRGVRKLFLAPNAGHAEALVKNPIEYDRQLEEFLREIGLAEAAAQEAQ